MRVYIVFDGEGEYIGVAATHAAAQEMVDDERNSAHEEFSIIEDKVMGTSEDE